MSDGTERKGEVNKRTDRQVERRGRGGDMGGGGWGVGGKTEIYGSREEKKAEFRSCVKVEVAVLGSPS